MHMHMPVEVSCAKINLKLKNIWKSKRIQGVFDRFSCFNEVFWSLFNLNWILAQKHIKVFILIPLRFFWHPWCPWGRVHIDLSKNSVQSGCMPLPSYRDDIVYEWPFGGSSFFFGICSCIALPHQSASSQSLFILGTYIKWGRRCKSRSKNCTVRNCTGAHWFYSKWVWALERLLCWI